MIEKTLYDYMASAVSVPVFTEIPSPIPPRFYLLEKTGGRREDHICYANIALQSYGVSLADAARMNLAGINAMLGAVALDSVIEVVLNSDYNFPDLTRKRRRYQAVFNITHYEEE